MDDANASEPTPDGLNKLDLTQLQDFKFGTQWTEIKKLPGQRREGSGSHGGRDDDRGRDGTGPARKDRRGFKKPMGPAGSDSPAPRPQDQGQRDFAPRGNAPMQRGERRDRPAPIDNRPYQSQVVDVNFYPEDAGFSALVKALRGSCRTYELFEIAKTVIGKSDRFIVVLQRKAPLGMKPGPLFLSVPDGVAFESEEAALDHVVTNHLGKFFDVGVVDIDPPKGNFQVVNRCTLSGELLGPPNYHKYSQILQQHHAANFPRMPFDRFKERIETVRDPELINAWLEKMKKTTRYSWKTGAVSTPAPVPAPADNAAEAVAPADIVASTEAAVPATDSSAATDVPAEASPVPEVSPVENVIAFDSAEEARAYLVSQGKEKVVRPLDTIRFPGKVIDTLPPGEIRHAVEGQLERQRRFPLDTANGLRGRLRREGFTIFKKGSQGVSYVCAVKRKFRIPGQTFATTISGLIGFVETHPMILAKDLASQFLGFALPTPAVEGAPTEGPTPEQQEKAARMQNDLRWLVREGYVTEFSDGKLFIPAPLPEPKKKSDNDHHEEHDPEDFPVAPAPAAAAQAPVVPEAAALETQFPTATPVVDVDDSSATPSSP